MANLDQVRTRWGGWWSDSCEHRAFAGESSGDGVVNSGVGDDDSGDAVAQGLAGAHDLFLHAALGELLDFVDLVTADGGDEGGVVGEVAEEAADVGEEEKCGGVERGGGACGGAVGVDVDGFVVGADGGGRDDGGVAGAQEDAEERG